MIVLQICILGLNYAPEPIGIGPYTAGLAQFLAVRGHDVTVIAGNPYYPDWKLAEGFERTGSVSEEQGVRIIRVPHYIPAKPSAIKRILHYLSFAKNAQSAFGRVSSADLVISIAPSLIAAPVALNIARRCGAVSWLHIQDFEVEAALATGILSQGAIARVASRFEKSVMSRFDWVSSISPMMVSKAMQKGASPGRTIELRNWADESVSALPTCGGAMRSELQIPEGIVALYSGNLALKQGCGLIVEAARLLSTRRNLQLVVCGAGPAREMLEAASQSLPNLHVRGLQPRERLNELLAMADMHLLPQIEAAADLVLPSKLTNMLASGRPIVATANLDTGLAREVEGCGIITAPCDPPAFAQAIVQLAENVQLRSDLGTAAAVRAQERWSGSVLLERFAVALEQASPRREVA